MQDKSDDKKKRRRKEINLSLSKSVVPTDLSKYPRVFINDETNKSGESEISQNRTDDEQPKKEESQLQKEINLTLRTSGVPTDFSKYPTVSVSPEEKNDAQNPAKNILANPTPREAQKEQQKEINLSLSRSVVPTDLSKYPTVTVARNEKSDSKSENQQPAKPQRPKLQIKSQPSDKPPTTAPASQSSVDTTINETVQLKKGLKVALRKSNKALDLDKYPKIVVAADDDDDTSLFQPLGEEKSEANKPDIGKELTGNETVVTHTNETVQLKKGLKVSLRRSAKALDLSKYPKVNIEDSKRHSPTGPSTTIPPRVKFADHIQSDDVHDTVQLMKNLKLSLSKSARAMDLRKYPTVVVDPDSKKQTDAIESPQQKLKLNEGQIPKSPVADVVDPDSKKKTNAAVSPQQEPKLGEGQIPKPPVANVLIPDSKKKTGAAETPQQTLKPSEGQIPRPPVVKEGAKDVVSEIAKQDQVSSAPKNIKKAISSQELAVEQEIAQNKVEKTEKPTQQKVQVEKMVPFQEKPQLQLKQDQGPGKTDPAKASSVEKTQEAVTKPKRILTQSSRTIPKIIDPTRRRDNATVQLSTPQSNLEKVREDRLDTAHDPGSDTVVLKVIKEKKKKLAGILSASQTIRLRPPTQPGFTPGGATPPVTEPAIPKKTLKLKAPGLAAASDDKAAAQPSERKVLKLKGSPAAEVRAKQIDPSEGEQTTVRSRNQRAAPERAGTPTAKATLKIKIPSKGSETAQRSGADNQVKSTLKIKAPPALTSSAPPISHVDTSQPRPIGKTPSAGTTAGKTLKLKAVPRPQFQQKTADSTTAQVAKVEPEKLETPQTGDSVNLDADIFYTVSAAAALVTVGISIYLMVSQFTSLF